MSEKKRITPRLLFADPDGQIFDHPDLVMLTRRGNEIALPRPEELIPLPEESELFLLPDRLALGFDQESGQTETLQEYAVAAFAAPGYTLTGTAAFVKQAGAKTLPLFAYGAVGFANGRFYVCAKKVDEDKRQVFANISRNKISIGAKRLLSKYPKNRLIAHLAGCALKYCCPAARNLALGRFEAPLPTAVSCSFRCLGCISEQPADSGFVATQHRISFTPTSDEIVEVMREHASKEKHPVFSFGQGCEGEPLSEAGLIEEAIKRYRKQGGEGTINVNTNGSRPEVMEGLAKAGLNSIRVSLFSARPELYNAYHRPVNFDLTGLETTITQAKESGLFVSLNFLFHPGIGDSEEEFTALDELLRRTKADMIQLRNLNLDPDIILQIVNDSDSDSPSMGLGNFMRRLRKNHPKIRFGYFNPYLADNF